LAAGEVVDLLKELLGINPHFGQDRRRDAIGLFEHGDDQMFDFEVLVLVAAHHILGLDDRFPCFVGELIRIGGLHGIKRR
jgi:hypothetical protein